MDESIMKNDWVSQLELRTVMKMAHDDLLKTGKRLRILVLYGSLRKRSYSKLLALEAARIFHRLGCDVRVYDPAGLPIKDDVQHDHPKVVELRGASQWSDGHFWVSPEQHGNLVRYVDSTLLNYKGDSWPVDHIGRLLSLRTKSTGYLSAPVPCAPRRAGPLGSPWSLGARSPLTQ
jgi:hypothetical protein